MPVVPNLVPLHNLNTGEALPNTKAARWAPMNPLLRSRSISAHGGVHVCFIDATTYPDGFQGSNSVFMDIADVQVGVDYYIYAPMTNRYLVVGYVAQRTEQGRVINTNTHGTHDVLGNTLVAMFIAAGNANLASQDATFQFAFLDTTTTSTASSSQDVAKNERLLGLRFGSRSPNPSTDWLLSDATPLQGRTNHWDQQGVVKLVFGPWTNTARDKYNLEAPSVPVVCALQRANLVRDMMTPMCRATFQGPTATAGTTMSLYAGPDNRQLLRTTQVSSMASAQRIELWARNTVKMTTLDVATLVSLSYTWMTLVDADSGYLLGAALDSTVTDLGVASRPLEAYYLGAGNIQAAIPTTRWVITDIFRVDGRPNSIALWLSLAQVPTVVFQQPGSTNVRVGANRPTSSFQSSFTPLLFVLDGVQPSAA